MPANLENLPVPMGFPCGSTDKESACNVGDLGLIPGLGKSPGGRHGNPLQYSCLEDPHAQRSLAGYSPRGCKESDTTEQLSTVQHQRQEHQEPSSVAGVGSCSFLQGIFPTQGSNPGLLHCRQVLYHLSHHV